MSTAAAIPFSKRLDRIEISATLAVVNEAAKLRAAGADIVDFGAGEPHFSTPDHIKEAAIAAIRNNFTKYTPVAGIPELRAAIASRHTQDFGSAYSAEEVVASTGGKFALFNVLQVLVDDGDEVVIPVPYWTSFKDIVAYAGGEPVFLETHERDGFSLTAKMVEAVLTSRTRVIMVNSPNNPSGAVIPPEELGAIARLAQQRGIFVISDECYAYLNYTGKRFSLGSVRDAKDNIVIIGSLSKTYAMTGWRLGYALGPVAVAGALQKLQSQSTSSTSAPVQKAAVAALTGPQDCIETMRSEYRQLRDEVVSGLRAIPGVQCNVPDGAFYAYPNVSSFFGRGEVRSAADIAGRLLREASVATVPGAAFGTRDHIRLSYAVPEKDLQRGLDRMKQFFAGL